MKTWRKLLAVILLGLTTLAQAGPVCVDPEGGIGGTGRGADPGTGGIGGTGHGGGEGGIGGTGAPEIGDAGEIGIVGTITGFASVCVNGLEVHYDAATPVTENGAAASLGQMAVGQVVAIDAVRTPRGLMARDIAIVHAFEGPVTRVFPGGKVVQVMGQTVNLQPGTRLAGAAAKGLAVGQMVKVSGLANAAGQVVASRIQLAPGLKEVSAAGPTTGHRAVAGIAIDRVAGNNSALVRGKWSDNRIAAAKVQADPVARLLGRAERVVVEALVQRPPQAGHWRAGGVEMRLDTGIPIVGGSAKDLMPDRLVRVTARRDADGGMRVERVEMNPLRPERRPADPGRAPAERGGFEGGATARAFDDRVERVEKVEKPEKAEKPEKPEKVEKPEKIEKPEKLERPQKQERPEKVERVEKTEKPERH